MNDVGIDAVCHGDLGDRCPGLGALRHHLRLRHRAVPPPRVRLLACHRVHLKLDAHDPCRREARNQDDLAGRVLWNSRVAGDVTKAIDSSNMPNLRSWNPFRVTPPKIKRPGVRAHRHTGQLILQRTPLTKWRAPSIRSCPLAARH